MSKASCDCGGAYFDFQDVENMMDAGFTVFDKNCDNKLDVEEFGSLCKALFRKENHEAYELKKGWVNEIFNIFDRNGDNYIDRQEFAFCWNQWIKTIVRPVSALIIVDAQNDFISGSLNLRNCPAGQNGEDVIRPINDLLKTAEFNAVFYTYDWHPNDHISFIDQVNLRQFHSTSPIKQNEAKIYDTVVFDGSPPSSQRLWPKHCVQDTWGSELHKDLMVVENSIKIYKGTNPDIDSYSAFWDNMKLSATTLDAQLKQKNVTDVYVVGVAYDVCVAYTAKDAIDAGYRTTIVDDCSRGVCIGDIQKTKKDIADANGLIVDSLSVRAMVSGNDKRPELGYYLAKQLEKREPSSVD